MRNSTYPRHLAGIAISFAVLLCLVSRASTFKLFGYKDKMEKYVLGYKLIKHLEPKHTYVHWDAPEQFPPVVLPARVISPHHPLLQVVQPPLQPQPVHVVPAAGLPAPQPLPLRPTVVARPPPMPQPGVVPPINRQDHGQLIVQQGGLTGNGKVKCPYEVYRIKQL